MERHVETGDHNFEGICGTNHRIIPYKTLSKHATDGYHGTSKGYHIICTRCGKKRWSQAGGYAYYCTEHYINKGRTKVAKDDWWSWGHSVAVPWYTCEMPYEVSGRQ